MYRLRVGVSVGGAAMEQINFSEYSRTAHFGHRKLTPRACVVDSQKHLRLFLSDALEDLGFVDQRMRSPRRSGRRAAGGAAGPDRAQRVRRRDQCRRNSRGHCPQKFRRQGPRHRSTRLDYGKGRQANWRRIQTLPCCPRCRRRSARRACAPASRSRLPAEPAPSPAVDVAEAVEGRLARIVVSAEDQHPHAGARAGRRRWSGCGIPPGAWSRRPTSFPTTRIRIFASCPNSWSAAPSRTGAICWRARGRSTFRSTCRYRSSAMPRRCAICAAPCPPTRPSAAF